MTEAPKIIQNSNGVWMLEGEQLWDTTILPVCLEHINEGDTVIDAGAWIGGHAMAYAEKVGESGKVFAFEPNPRAFRCLMSNTNSGVHCFPIALGGKSELVSFRTEKGWQDSGHVEESDRRPDVVMRPLDDYEITPNFIKMDVEGCELKVLKGAVKTIEKSKPIMVIEINKPALERQGNTPHEIWAWLIDNNYCHRDIGDTSNPDIYNILCIPK